MPRWVDQPVCGCNGIRYSNTRFAKLAQGAIAYDGERESDDECRHYPATGIAAECE
jgi:hypothetical protein